MWADAEPKLTDEPNLSVRQRTLGSAGLGVMDTPPQVMIQEVQVVAAGERPVVEQPAVSVAAAGVRIVHRPPAT
jgi:hypothetical protein